MSVAVLHGSSLLEMDQSYEWRSDDKDLERLANSILDEDGPSGADPHPEETAANEFIARFGGELVHSEPPKRLPGVMY